MTLEWVLTEWRMLLVFALILLALVLFVRELLPFEITALLVLVILAATGTLSLEEAFSGFSNHAVLTVLMMFVLSAGVLQSGLVDWAAGRLGRVFGTSVTWQVLMLAAIIGPVSAFVNNTPAVAVMIPLVVGLANKAGTSPSKLLMPLSFAAMLGGVTTLIGTSTNLLASDLRREAGLGAFGVFEFTKAGVIIFGVGLLYLALVGHRLLPARLEAKSVDERFHLREFLLEVRVPERSTIVGQVIGEAKLQEKFGVTTLRLVREGIPFNPMETRLEYRVGDELLLRGKRDAIQRMADTGVVEIVPVREAPKDVKMPELRLAELLVGPGSWWRGRRLGDIDLWGHHRVQTVALLSRGHHHAVDLADQRLREGDVLLVTGESRDLETLYGGEDFHVLGGPETPLRRPHKIPFVLAIFVGVVGLAAAGIPILLTATAGAILMVVLGILRLEEMYRSIRWDVLLLLAGILPLGLALDQTGGATMLARGLATGALWLPPIGVLILVYVVTTLLTEVMSNNAAVVLIVPVALRLAQILDYNPTTMVLAVMFAASTSLLTPVGYQTNLMVLGPGGYRFTDFMRVGAPLNALLAVVTPLVLAYFWPLT